MSEEKDCNCYTCGIEWETAMALEVDFDLINIWDIVASANEILDTMEQDCLSPTVLGIGAVLWDILDWMDIEAGIDENGYYAYSALDILHQEFPGLEVTMLDCEIWDDKIVVG